MEAGPSTRFRGHGIAHGSNRQLQARPIASSTFIAAMSISAAVPLLNTSARTDDKLARKAEINGDPEDR